MSEVSGELLPTTMFAGELSLDGTLRPVRGVLPLAVKARDEGLRRLVVPAENAAEAAVVRSALPGRGDRPAERGAEIRCDGAGGCRGNFGVAECLCRGFRRRERTDGRKAGAGDRGGRRT